MAFDTRRVLRSWWLILLQLSVSSLFVVAQSMNGQESSEPAYILFAESTFIMKMNLNGTGIEVICGAHGYTVEGLDYHYRNNTVYWIGSYIGGTSFSSLNKINLDTKAETCTHLIRTFEGIAGGIAVDWINDKVYLTAGHKIFEFDPNTDVFTEIAVRTGIPKGIVVFPHKNNTSLYFMEEKSSMMGSLIRLPVNGGTQTVLIEQHTMCPNTITMDYPNMNIYWNYGCRKQVHMMRINGTKHSRLDDGNTHLQTNTHSNGIAYYNEVVYWTDGQRIIRFDTTTSTSDQLYKGFADGIRIVHSSLQPTEDQLRLYEMCTSIQCVHGQCIGNASFCVCDPGWSGDACDQDFDECKVNNGGCEVLCVNTAGSFQCGCHEGQTLESNKINCSDLNSPVPVSVTPIPSSQPTGSRNPNPVPSTDPILVPSTDPIPVPSTDPIPVPSTDPIPNPSTDPIPIPSTDPIPILSTDPIPDSSTDPVPSTDLVTDLIFTPVSATTSSLTRDHVTTTASNAMTSSSSSSSESTNTVPTTSSTDDKKKPEPPTSGDDYDPAKTTPTQPQQLRPTPTPEVFGLEPNKKQPEGTPNLLIIVVSTATGTVVIASIFCYVIFLYCKLSRRRRGSYDVNKRKRARDVESVTSSARSSFRAVSEYHYSPNLESQFLRQILPGSTSSMSEESTTVSVAPATSSESVSASSSAASESSAVSESRPLRSDS